MKNEGLLLQEDLSDIWKPKFTNILKNVYIIKIDEIIDKPNKTCNRAIKMKAVSVKPGTYIDFDVENNDKNPNSKVGDHFRILKYAKKIAKG